MPLGNSPQACAKPSSVSPTFVRPLLAWGLALLCLLLVGCGSGLVPLSDRTMAQGVEPQALVVRLSGVLGTQEIALCHRALRQAQARSLPLVFLLEDAGGDAESVADVQGLLDHMEQARSSVPTTAVASGHVRSMAAALALLCDQLWFLRQGDLGSITPLPSTLEQLEQMTDESAEGRRWRELGEDFVRRLQSRREALSNDALKLCQGMADPGLRLVSARLRERGLESSRIVDAKELTGLQAAGAVVLDQRELVRPVVLDQGEAEAERIALGTLQSLDQLCTDVLRVEPRAVAELAFSWSEDMVGWLELFQPAFLVLGLVLLVLEIKTPGVGLPGLFGIGFLSLALFYSWLVGLADVAEIALFFLGIALLATEIFLMPGVIVFGALGFVALVLSLVLSRQTFLLPGNRTQEDILFHNLLQLTGLFVTVLVVAGLMGRLLPKVPLLRRLYLPAPLPAGPAAVTPADERTRARLQQLVGKLAQTVTVLRPAGVVEIDGERFDVVAEGEFVERGRTVRVNAVQGNRIVVGEAEDRERGEIGLILLIAILGVVLLIAEVFFVSFGVLTLLSGSALVAAVFLAFQQSQALGIGFLVGEAIVAPLALWGAFRALPKTPFGRALMLEGPKPEEVHGGAMDPQLKTLVGRRGKTLSPLRPAGFARIDGRKVDVVTRGEMIDEGQEVEVLEALGNRVVVRALVGDNPHNPLENA
jgi:membrane-bound serine protease (ClpP class)